ncbi:SDR family oxidoreductase [Streptomyces sp. NBS 14/10]|uniref:SDR family oxidoreductase n=1 Tax=Streptomyces sp. NBS 14/10 TaxID=1945643 RepID=UPI000B7F110E|nr:SDR family oxidoreductase [Streptomyces sp. NBS 14/10]KAK1183097.1 SDR family oxidoreductase [Streptomyces sp. NBS 14/10]
MTNKPINPVRHRPKVVVVTGASAGVGRATARAFADRGDRVALLARGGAGLAAAAEDVVRSGGEALVVPLDIADHKSVDEAAVQVEEEFGPIDIWVNNAFAAVFAPFTEIGPEEFRRITDVCYLGFVNGTRAALRHMLPRDRGAVVQVGSALAYRGIPLQSAYCGAKHAIQGWHESLRCELLHRRSRVRVTMVQLPAVNTPQFDWLLTRLPHKAQPLPPIYQPEVAARTVRYAADHPRRREYWVGGGTTATLLANKVVPGLLDRYLARTGFDGQQRPDPADPSAPGNLWLPADGSDGRDFGAHGSFDDRTARHVVQPWLARHRPGLVLTAAAVAAGACGALAATRLRERK